MKYETTHRIFRSVIPWHRLSSGLVISLISILCLTAGLVDMGRTHADPLPVIEKYGTLSSNQSWASGYVYLVDGSGVTVPDGVTLTIDAGAIVKTTGGAGTGISVSSGGTLDVSGASGNPVIFTSDKDDTVGGDSNGDGASTGAVGDYQNAIASVDGGTVDVSHATFKFANLSLYQVCTDGSSTTLNDNTFNSAVFAQYCTEGQLSLERNNFDVDLDGSDAPLAVGSSDVNGIVLTGSNKNTFSGSGQQLALQLFDSDTVASDTTWTVDNASGARLLVDNLTVSGTLNLYAGAIIKTETTGGSSGTGITVASSGTLNFYGTSESPVVFTSDKDDSVGGDTNGDGSSTGAADDYPVAIRYDDSGNTDTISYAVMKFAGSALSLGINNTLDVNHVQFTDNDDAIDADTTSTENEILGSLASDCLYPYGNSVDISDSWFGSSGLPGVSTDLSSYLGLTIPDGYPGLSDLYSYATSMVDSTVHAGDNALPATLFTCGIPDGPTLTFPVTPVNIPDLAGSGIAGSELWTAANYAE